MGCYCGLVLFACGVRSLWFAFWVCGFRMLGSGGRFVYLCLLYGLVTLVSCVLRFDFRLDRFVVVGCWF